jgi:hypothetical protein
MVRCSTITRAQEQGGFASFAWPPFGLLSLQFH